MYNGSTPVQVVRPPIDVGGVDEGAMGVKSSTVDFLKFYRSFLHAAKDQQSKNANSTVDSPFKQVTQLLKSRVTLSDLPEGTAETTYALGWAGTQLPSALETLGLNPGLQTEMPVIGNGIGGHVKVLHHAGSLAGYLTAVILLPETSSAIVVLSNTLVCQDFSNWAS